jgi:hypothetical protein
MALHHDDHSPTEILSWSMEMVIPHASYSNEDSEAAHRGKNQGMKKTTRHPELGSDRIQRSVHFLSFIVIPYR